MNKSRPEFSLNLIGNFQEEAKTCNNDSTDANLQLNKTTSAAAGISISLKKIMCFAGARRASKRDVSMCNQSMSPANTYTTVGRDLKREGEGEPGWRVKKNGSGQDRGGGDAWSREWICANDLYLDDEYDDQSGPRHKMTRFRVSSCNISAGVVQALSLDVKHDSIASCKRRDMIRGPKAQTANTISRSGAGAMNERMRREDPSESTVG